MKDIELLQRELGQIFPIDLGTPSKPMMLGVLSPEAERHLIEEWKEEWDHLTLPELEEEREILAQKLKEAKRWQLEAEHPGVTPGYVYFPGLRLRAMNELVEEKGGKVLTEQVCPACGSRLLFIPPAPGGIVSMAWTWVSCPVCNYANLFYAPTGGYELEIVERGGWPIPVEPEAEPEPEPEAEPKPEAELAPPPAGLSSHLLWIIPSGLIMAIIVIKSIKKKRR